MGRHTPLQQFKEAKQIAADHGLFLLEKTGAGSTTYLVYRKTPGKNVYLGKRTSAAALRAFVCKCANFH